MRPAQIAASAACTQAEGSFRVEVFVSAFGRRRFCGRVHLQTHSRRTEKRCCFVLAAAAGRASRQERCKTLEKARGEAFSAAFRYLDGCRAAFVRHAGLYAKDCGRAFLFGERLHVIPAAFVPRDGAPRRLSHAERLRRGHPAAICGRCQLICFSARGAPYPASRFCFARRIRSAAGARPAPSHAPVAFVRHAGLYAKDCGRAFLFGKRLHVIPAAFVPRDGAPRRLSHAERLRRLTYRPFLVRPARLCNVDARLARRSAQFRSFARSVCAAGVRPRFVFDAS